MNDVTPEERQKKAFKRWYEQHKKLFNAKRRERYSKDPEYRKKAIQMVRNARNRKEETGQRIRVHEYQGKVVPVFSITEVAFMIERSPDTIRTWERKEFIPKPLFDGPIRLYTQGQVHLLRWLVSEVDKGHSKMKQKEIFEDCKEEMFKRWEEN